MAEKIETFGASIPALAGNQLKLRQDLFKNPSKSLSNLTTINSNTAWVVLRSSVNEVSDKSLAEQALKDPKKADEILSSLSSEKAELFVLTGGRATAFFDTEVQGINYGTDYNAGSTYNYDQRLGVRPMPGITSLKVAAKNTYGTLMQAEVGFTVWTLADLERAELLFLRPGYTTLLEWGHSVYLTAEDQVRFAGKAQLVKESTFFNRNKPSVISKEIETLRNDAKGNYDGMYGYITNFSWAFREDGGYDCTIKVVSRGVILESLSMGKTSDVTEAEKEKEEKEKEERKSKFHFAFTRLEKNESDNTFNGKDYLAGEGKAADFADPLQSFDVFRMNQDIAGEGFLGFDKTINLVYMPLRAVVDIANQHFLPYNPRTKESLCEISLDYGERYVTFPQHMSVDPLVAVKPTVPSNLNALGDDYGNAEDFTILLGEVTKNMVKYVGDKSDDILNIMVSNVFIKKCVSNVIDGAQEEGIGFHDFISEVCTGINNAFGEVNDIGLYYDHIFDVYKLVDRRNTNTTAQLQELDITGLSSTVVGINLDSKISSAVSSQVSIAAQGNSGNYKDNIEAILKWNAGAIDRHIEVKQPTKEDLQTRAQAEEAAKKRRVSYIKDLRDVWTAFNNAERSTDGSLLDKASKFIEQTITNQTFDAEKWNQLRAEGISEMNRFYKRTRTSPIKGVVPVELSLKLLGVSGFKIGTAFKIKPGLLPSKYDAFAYIITGVDHEIGTDNKWYTNVKTQFYAIQ